MGVAVTAIVRTLAAALDAITELETALDATFAHLWGSETRCGVLTSVPGVLPGHG